MDQMPDPVQQPRSVLVIVGVAMVMCVTPAVTTARAVVVTVIAGAMSMAKLVVAGAAGIVHGRQHA